MTSPDSQKAAQLHSIVKLALAQADQLGLVVVGIALDKARLELEEICSISEIDCVSSETSSVH
jgi:hypothetical protein